MNHEKILSELESWLDLEAQSYASGELMGLSESIVGEKIIKDVLVKLADLKTTTG